MKKGLFVLILTGFLSLCASAQTAPAPVSDSVSVHLLPTLPTFGGYMLSSGPLYYDGDSFELHSEWDLSSYSYAYGVCKGSTYFDYISLGKYFDSRKESFNMDSGNIDNLGGHIRYAGYDDWRLPSVNDWKSIVGIYRPGAVVNGMKHACFAMVMLRDYAYLGMSSCTGLLLFPDNVELSGKRLFEINTTRVTHDFKESDLDDYLSKGCVFLPMAGYYSIARLGWYFGGAEGWYQSSDCLTDNDSVIMFYGCRDIPGTVKTLKVYHFLPVRLVRRAKQ